MRTDPPSASCVPKAPAWGGAVAAASFCGRPEPAAAGTSKESEEGAAMGLLSQGSPLSWEETKRHADHVRRHGILQFLNIYHAVKDRHKDVLKWGDEVSARGRATPHCLCSARRDRSSGPHRGRRPAVRPESPRDLPVPGAPCLPSPGRRPGPSGPCGAPA